MNRYILIGAGGTGGFFIPPALIYLNSYHRNRSEPWEFIVADGDHYEVKNLERQNFDPKLLGVNKADAVKYTYPQYPIKSMARFVGESELQDLMVENCVVFIGVDNHSLRALVEKRALQLKNCVVINAGNEYHDGSVQLWVRENGENKTPRIGWGHPEIKYSATDDRAFMSCTEVAQLPGGEQLILANMGAATHMIEALWRFHNGFWQEGWTELFYDFKTPFIEYIDMRARRNWAN